MVVLLPSAGASIELCETERTGSISVSLLQDAKRKGISNVNKTSLFITIEFSRIKL